MFGRFRQGQVSWSLAGTLIILKIYTVINPAVNMCVRGARIHGIFGFLGEICKVFGIVPILWI